MKRFQSPTPAPTHSIFWDMCVDVMQSSINFRQVRESRELCFKWTPARVRQFKYQKFSLPGHALAVETDVFFSRVKHALIAGRCERDVAGTPGIWDPVKFAFSFLDGSHAFLAILAARDT